MTIYISPSNAARLMRYVETRLRVVDGQVKIVGAAVDLALAQPGARHEEPSRRSESSPVPPAVAQPPLREDA